MSDVCVSCSRSPRRSWASLAMALVLGAASAIGCSSRASSPACAGRCVGSGIDAGTTRDAATVDGPSGTLVVEPASIMLHCVDGVRPTQELSAWIEDGRGSRTAARGATFTVQPALLARVDPETRVLTASCVAGGVGTIVVTAPLDSGGYALGTAALEIYVDKSVEVGDVPADAAARFVDVAPPGPDSADIAYPLDGVVMPQNVFPADIQWNRGASGDLFRVRLIKSHFTGTIYVAALGNHVLPDYALWAPFAQSDGDAVGTIEVDRWVASRRAAVGSVPVHAKFARTALNGSVYYWEIASTNDHGRILRIDDGTNARVTFLPTPPGTAPRSQRCIGCHSVSPSGRWLAGRVGPEPVMAAELDLTADLTGDPPPTRFETSPDIDWFMSTWRPDERRMIVSLEAGTPRFELLDPTTGAFMRPRAGTLPTMSTQPAWSPDGTQIAFTTNIEGGWAGNHRAGDIAVLPVTGDDAFGEPTVLHRGPSLAVEMPTGLAGFDGTRIARWSTDSYPTWSPDSALIAFAHGSGSRSESDRGDLWLMQRDGSGVVALERGGSGNHADYQPRFSPFRGGGYHWLSFLSRRPYGNAEVGTSDPDPARAYQQIWIMAIRDDAAPGEDASEVPYWVPGQSTEERNIAAYWAPRACRPNGESCDVGASCCSGNCGPPPEGGSSVCIPPPVTECRMRGETCAEAADCCGGMSLDCISNVCTTWLF